MLTLERWLLGRLHKFSNVTGFCAGCAPVGQPVFLTFGSSVLSGGKTVSVSTFLSGAFQ